MDREEFGIKWGEFLSDVQIGLWERRLPERITGSFPIPIWFIEKYLERGVSSIWDIGCGDGEKTLALNREGFNVFGVDTNIDGFVHAAEQGAREFQRILFAPFDVGYDVTERIKLNPPELDGVLFQAVLTDLLSFGVQNAAKNIHALLKPGGVVLISDFLRNDQDYSFDRFGMTDEEREESKRYWAARYQQDAEFTFDEGTIVVLKDRSKEWRYGGFDLLDFLLMTDFRILDHFAKHWSLDEIQTMFPGFTLEEYKIWPARTKRHLVTGVFAAWRKN